MSMDKGQYIKDGFDVRAGENGSWIVSLPYNEGRRLSRPIGFSNSIDLLRWLNDEFGALRLEAATGRPEVRSNG